MDTTPEGIRIFAMQKEFALYESVNQVLAVGNLSPWIPEPDSIGKYAKVIEQYVLGAK